jgi:PAS domain S-box-containing protein
LHTHIKLFHINHFKSYPMSTPSYQELLQQHQLYKAIINTQGEMICRFRPDTTLTFVNKGYCDYFNMPKEKLIGHKFLELIPGEDHQPILDHLQRITHSREVIPFEHQVRMPSGELRWQEWTDYPIFDENETLVEFQSVGRDITKTKKYQEKLLDISASKDRIMATVAHDLRNPISGILGICNVLEMKRQDQEVQDFIHLIRLSCESALHIMEELLEMAEIENENFVLQKQPENLGSLINEAISLLAADAEEQQISLESNLSDHALVAPVNQKKFSRVLMNLLSNALKFTGEGGKVTVGLDSDNSHAIVYVKDTGIGIPRAMQAGIFDKFTKAKRFGLKGEKTHGLGLYICKQIVELHGGRIFLESEEGVGTTVFVKLPLDVPKTPGQVSPNS